ncbi:transmembrane protein 131 homolog [Uranotaenia lowii]|uniref:transmembrane protein 131 homolog n=1 Tax=Uranotaenia lowii TaxID=190385 RepID=UPI00247A3157|nr:transmembrane protein 131 homolog [Uranotaenia lowii]
MASKKRSVRVFSLLVIFLQFEVQVQSQQHDHNSHQGHQNEQLNFGAQEIYSSSSQQEQQQLMDEMFQGGEGVLPRGGLLDKTSPELVGNLIFQPSLLDFLERSIGDPHNQVVILINKHKSRSVVLGSISGNTPDFYSSYFKDMVIPPEGNTTFNVVFLPRQLGATAGSIEIHTSFGLLQYHVQGEGIECPYRLKPLVGLKAPLNATLTPEITLHNPHDTPLQIVEIYSSGGNFQLELPTGAQEGPQAMWEIPPHSTQSVIRVRFHGKSPGNHSAYVRIKISGGSQQPSLVEKMLVVPIEIEISKETGYYSKVPFLDMALDGTKENSTVIKVNFTNSGNTYYMISGWGIFSDNFVLDPSKTKFNRQNNQLQFEIDWSKVTKDIQYFRAELDLEYRKVNQGIQQEDFVCRVPLTIKLLHGQLDYDPEILKFLTLKSEEHNENLQTPRAVVIQNKFNVPLSISNISVPENCSSNFLLQDFHPTIIAPNKEKTLFRISRILADNLNQSIATYVRILTNISNYDLPIYSFTGRLKRILPFSTTIPRTAVDYQTLDLDEKQLNFGILPTATLGEALIAFFNPNPIPIPIRHWKGQLNPTTSSTPTITVILRGCGPAVQNLFMFCHTIPPQQWIVYQISVQSSSTDSYQGRFSIVTDYEEIVTPISFTTAIGKLELNRELLHFGDCFPGKICSLNLTAHSTFLSKIHVEGIKTDVEGIEFTVESRHPPVIHPNTVTNIGKLVFDPKVICRTDCYSSFDLLSKPFGVKWMATLDNYEQYRKLDSEKLLQQLKLYADMKKAWQSIRFQLTTDPIRKFEFNASVDLVWPKLLTENIYFPTLQIEQEAVKLITINNPSDQILFVHLVLHDVKVHGSDISSIPPEILSRRENCSLSEENVFSFFLFDYDDIYVNYVKPKSFLKIAVKFTAKEPGTYSTIFYMRNNLTLIDAVWIQAKAVVPQFKFGNRKPGSATALQFEITDKHLKMCTKFQEPGAEAVSIQTKRSFTARNYGEVPIAISGIRVEDLLCEGYGFKVLDCWPFELQPNASKKIEIAFSPDFTLARVTRTLNFDTNINFSVNFTLLGTVPAHGLESCSLSLRRPWFESILRVALICVLPLALVGALIAAFLESNKVIRDHILNMSRDRGPIQPPLDLRQIALQSPVTTDDQPEKVTNGPNKGNQNNSKKKAPPRQQLSNNRLSNGNAISGLNKTWNEFTSKIGRGLSSKLSSEPEANSNKHSPESTEKKSQKNRRSITPSKENTASASNLPMNAKDRNKSPVEEDSSSTTTECSESSSISSSSSGSSGTSSVTTLSATSMYKAEPIVHTLLQSSKSANCHHQQQQQLTKACDLKAESNSNSTQNVQMSNGYHQQQQSKASPQQTQPVTVGKTNVKKTKSLPVAYESSPILAAEHQNSSSTASANVQSKPRQPAAADTLSGITTALAAAAAIGLTATVSPSSENAGKATGGSATTNGTGSGNFRNNVVKNQSNDKGKSSKSSEKPKEYIGKESGAAFGENLGKNDSSSGKKFGKTPGRERKSNSQGKKSGNQKTLHKAQVLQFPSSGSSGSKPGGSSAGSNNGTGASFFLTGSNIPTNATVSGAGNQNVWGENRARFSDVVAQASLDKAASNAAKFLNFDLSAGLERFGLSSTCDGILPQNDGTTKSASSGLFGKSKDDGCVGTEKDLNVSVGPELGPIGTSKKSPTSSPKCWEPFGNSIPRPTSLALGNDIEPSESYFSQHYGDFNHNSVGDQFRTNSNLVNGSHSNQASFGGMNNSHPMSNSSGPIDSGNDLNNMVLDHRDWDTEKMLWQMIQKEESNTNSLVDWSSLWTAPTVYSQNNNHLQHQQQQLPALQASSRLANSWLNTSTVGPSTSARPPHMPLRAPPGFSPVKPTPNHSILLQQAQHQQQQQQQHQQQMQAQFNALQQQQQQNNLTAYDPFRLSSIWAPANSGADVWSEKK